MAPMLSPQLLTSPKAMEPSWTELCPVSRCQLSDGMDGRDSYAEEEQASLDQVVLAKNFFFFLTVCLLASQRGVTCLPHKTTNMSVRMLEHFFLVG